MESESTEQARPEPSTPPLQVAPRRIPATFFVWVLTAINVLVWIAMELVGSSTSTQTLIAFGAKVNALIARGEYWRLITPIFIHIGLMHLLFNSFALLSFGRLAEAIFGHARFLAIYLVSGITGVAFSYFFSRSLSAGASGAIFGISGALVVFFFVNRRVPAISAQNQLTSMLLVLGFNAFYGFVQPGIDNWGHTGGVTAGIALAVWLTPRIVPVVDSEGKTVAYRAQPSSVASWLAVPSVLAIVAVGVATVPPR
jgi:rhomboid protease GluP